MVELKGYIHIYTYNSKGNNSVSQCECCQPIFLASASKCGRFPSLSCRQFSCHWVNTLESLHIPFLILPLSITYIHIYSLFEGFWLATTVIIIRSPVNSQILSCSWFLYKRVSVCRVIAVISSRFAYYVHRCMYIYSKHTTMYIYTYTYIETIRWQWERACERDMTEHTYIYIRKGAFVAHATVKDYVRGFNWWITLSSWFAVALIFRGPGAQLLPSVYVCI